MSRNVTPRVRKLCDGEMTISWPVETPKILMHVMDMFCYSRPAVISGVGTARQRWRRHAPIRLSGGQHRGGQRHLLRQEPRILFVNVQHAVTQNDKKMVATNRQAKDLDDVRSIEKPETKKISAIINDCCSLPPTFQSIHI